jgi:hypothetical protein
MFISKTIFSRNSRLILIKLDANLPQVKSILDYSNKGSDPLQRGDNQENAKIWRGH